MLHPLDWDDDEVTKPHVSDDAAAELLPSVDPFNPRIRIIGVSAPLGFKPGTLSAPAVALGPAPHVVWKDAAKTAQMPRVSIPRPLPPRRPKTLLQAQLSNVVVDDSIELRDDDLQEIAPLVDSCVTIAPIVELSGSTLRVVDEETEPETVEKPEAVDEDNHEDDDDDDDTSGIRTAELGPPPNFAQLEWTDNESGTHPLLNDSLPTWEDEDDMTMPRRFNDLRARARELAEAWNNSKAAIDAQTKAVEEDLRSAGGDTMVDVEPPSAVRELVALSEPFEDTEPASQPQPPSIMSVEIDLAELGPLVSDDDEPELQLTPAPRARRPSREPARLPSVAPVAFSAPPPAPTRGSRVGVYALSVVAAACIAIFASVLVPSDGSLVVRLRTADGHPASKAEIYVDGQKQCDTDPCVVGDLSSGKKTVKVIVPGHPMPRVATVNVSSGEEQVVWIDLPALPDALPDEGTAAADPPLPVDTDSADDSDEVDELEEKPEPTNVAPRRAPRRAKAAPPVEDPEPESHEDFDPYEDD